MPKQLKIGQDQRAVIAALLALAVVIGVFDGQSSRQPPSDQHSAANAKNTSPIQTAEKPANITDWLLVLFSGLLFGSNVFLWRANNRSASVAERSAENAEKVLHSLEVPHLFPVNMSFKVRKDKNDAPETAFISISLKNFGRSPAFPRHVYIIAAINTPDLRQSRFHSGQKHFMPPDVIGDKEIVGPFEHEIKELAGFYRQIIDGVLLLRVMVGLNTEDLMEHDRRGGSWYVWNPKTERFSPGIQVWAPN